LARLEAELDAARRNVERFRRQLDRANSRSTRLRTNNPTANALGSVATDLGSVATDQHVAPEVAAPGYQQSRPTVADARANHRRASLGHIIFTYEDVGSDGTVLAYDRPTKRLMWTLKAPLNADSIIQCYDNETLLIKSADGYTRLLNAEDGKLTKAWAPGAEAPAPAQDGGVNPFGLANAFPNLPHTSAPETAHLPSPNAQDQEKRIERIEENLRLLTEAVNRLTREQKEQRGSSAPTGRDR
jgi:hypothetical protein